MSDSLFELWEATDLALDAERRLSHRTEKRVTQERDEARSAFIDGPSGQRFLKRLEEDRAAAERHRDEAIKARDEAVESRDALDRLWRDSVTSRVAAQRERDEARQERDNVNEDNVLLAGTVTDLEDALERWKSHAARLKEERDESRFTAGTFTVGQERRLRQERDGAESALILTEIDRDSVKADLEGATCIIHNLKTMIEGEWAEDMLRMPKRSNGVPCKAVRVEWLGPVLEGKALPWL